MLSYKFPLRSGNPTHFFVIFILLVLIGSGFTIHNAVNAWLLDKRYAMADIAHLVQKRINTYRFATWQIYENLATSAAGSQSGSLQETRLRPDVYYLEKNRRKTESLIFGSHDSSTLDMAMRMSNYLDTLWGAENSTWSMYFLDGQDNSLIFISTLPLKDMATRYKESAISNIVDTRHTEMLQQANALDERESFSPLRRFTWQNDHYFTVRTTFNQPGHLATVVAFDLPVNDLIPLNMPLENFQIKHDSSGPLENSNVSEATNSTSVSLNNPNIEISASLTSTPLQLVYRVRVFELIVDTFHNLMLPLIANLLMILLSLCGIFLIRQQSRRPNENQSAELDSLRVLNEEIVSSLPVGLLVYDFSSNRTIISNKIAEHLLPHLNLQKIISMSDQHQGVLQATVNNEVYEIRHARSVISPNTQLFMMRDQDRELLVNKKLQKAQQILDKNHQTRQQLLQNLGHALNRPLNNVIIQLQQLSLSEGSDDVSDVLESSQALSRLVDDIVLLNRLETHDWAPDAGAFNVQTVLDELVTEALPSVRRKGLNLLVNNRLGGDENRFGDRRALYKILTTLLHYSITTTTWGRITIEASHPEGRPDALLIEIVDTGAGLKADELGNADFPFLGETTHDRFSQTSGLALFLIKQLCKQLGGHLEIVARPDIGTRYTVQIQVPQELEQPQEEKLLEGLTTLIDISVDDVRKIVVRQLENWGANCITPDERFSGQGHDILITDESANMTPWALLLNDNEAGFTAMSRNQFRVNFNLSNAMQDALLQLIEQQLSMDESVEEQNVAQLFSPGYFQLFVDTVPDDVKRLYNESAEGDLSSLAQTAHRLKGVFAMLNLIPGKQLCETLEQHITECDISNIKNTTSEIDNYVNELLLQGNQII
ncbi:phosphotransferase RcsD [Erwinia tracheiphila]|uniref:Phosphotransferase RcsD n=1 Tax=Erwinia tracheiphila TaxID=65700 RepID=A0A0M2K733_9GAMM|nr:phosphotransferase RcsD [Erwinia tracheiphila]AXF76458.1 phosphotransferase RcsD [Erwinia tracheiphila]EOS96239.1 phosphotransfer intermediate protein in two-component regulatory system with RcsBC [Erwinia tracheiphila PSU-1]KKF35200.1 tRNA(5-methylaminomethyl-2-thiouridylate) methyltransferase [Erwinia tracheiphila]UIA84877.1 phosphotransferase RcsD [Erwinia tracheiphila]UIA86855.1 phosphotransferase RcsD [Erwinia tracheiphila]